MIKYVKTKHLRDRYQVSDMTLKRWEDDPRSGFPQPIRINRQKLWLESDLDAWDAAQRPAPRMPGVSSAA